MSSMSSMSSTSGTSGMSGTSHIVVLTTVASEEDGARIARELVVRRLAACVNLVGPVRSIYRWKGEVQDEREHLLLIKTRADSFPRLEQAIAELHRYELPEVVALPVVAGEETYLNWLSANSAEVPSELP